MIIWFFLISSPLPIYTKDTQFECGDHGRFEYCIDGIPGCIVGCHCHPGYYFDTDTKICEPNSKLMQAYRRHYAGEPTRISQINSPEVLETSTSFSTVGIMDDHVDAIAQNADDLGDWLYNQFYKTIESQVINKTNDNLITRRSGKKPTPKTKKGRKKERQVSLKKKQKKDDLRRKLLRITEDDSLFDSDADTDTDTDSSHSSSIDETRESKDKEHGHKKFVIVNKKPKPQLPSFIFLPNIETPFYPPVGLPPPVLPMYPMVPVPPVLPSYSFPNVPPDCQATNLTTSATSTFSSTTQSILTSPTTKLVVGTTDSLDKPKPKTDITTISDIESSTMQDATGSVLRKRRRKKEHVRRDRNDILRRLRELVENAAPNPANKMKKTRVDPLENLERDSVDDFEEAFPMQQMIKQDLHSNTNEKAESKQEDKANFKYLSELIHRIHLNDTKTPAGMIVKPSFQQNKPFIDYKKNTRVNNKRPKIVEPTRRLNYEMDMPHDPKKTDNSFYTNLGTEHSLDNNSSRKIQNSNIFIKNEIPNFKPHEIKSNVILPKRQPVLIPHRQTNTHLASLSPLFDFNIKQYLNVNE
ncbi:unnamed protein product, partial [Iphiclides podalirius]